MSKYLKALSAVSLLLTAPVTAQQCHNLDGVTAVGQDLQQLSPFRGQSCVSIEQGGTNVYRQCFGNLGRTDVIPIASATKTLSAAVLLTIVDSGFLSLDDRVGQYLPEWNTGDRAQITLRMCFAHTSGLPANDPAISDTSLTLRQAAAQLAALPLDNPPGTAFAYGNVSMHVAGSVCEVVTGLSWKVLFEQRIAQPLGMDSTDYGDPTVNVNNPLIAGGARSNERDFARFMTMLRANGSFGGRQILSQNAVEEMLREQTGGTSMVRNVHPDQVPYGLGIWVERQDSAGDTLRAAAAGAFGFTGWVDRAHDVSGVMAVQFLWPLVYPFTQRIQEEVDLALLPDGITCLGDGTPVCLSEAWLNSTLPPRAGSADFALLASRVQPLAVGSVAIGDPAPLGIPLLDLTLFVDPGATFVAPVLADGDGIALLPAPLPATLAGQNFAVQTFWTSNAPCAVLGAQATHAIRVNVLP